MSETKAKPEWQEWPEERHWKDPRNFNPISFSVMELALMIRKYDCGIALSGIRNPAAVREVIEAADRLAALCNEYDETGVDIGRLEAALAKLDQEPEA